MRELIISESFLLICNALFWGLLDLKCFIYFWKINYKLKYKIKYMLKRLVDCFFVLNFEKTQFYILVKSNYKKEAKPKNQ